MSKRKSKTAVKRRIRHREKQITFAAGNSEGAPFRGKTIGQACRRLWGQGEVIK